MRRAARQPYRRDLPQSACRARRRARGRPDHRRAWHTCRPSPLPWAAFGRCNDGVTDSTLFGAAAAAGDPPRGPSSCTGSAMPWRAAISTPPCSTPSACARWHECSGREMTMRLSDFRVLTFDCYGTLIDWESGIVAALQPLMAKGKVRARPRHGARKLRSPRGGASAQHAGNALRRSALERPSDPRGGVGRRRDRGGALRLRPLRPRLARLPRTAPRRSLSLKRHYKLVILSNVYCASFSGSNARLGVAFDAVYTAEDIGSYKPDRRNFAYMLAALGEQGIGRNGHPAYRPEPVSRPCAGKGIRSRDRPDRPPSRAGGMGRHAPRGRGALRFPLREPRRDGGGAPQRCGRARLRLCTAGRPKRRPPL